MCTYKAVYDSSEGYLEGTCHADHLVVGVCFTFGLLQNLVHYLKPRYVLNISK